MYNTKDNIVALATTPSKSALSVVRCSGSGAFGLYKKLTKATSVSPPNYVHLKTVYFKKSIIDEMMIVCFASPKSYTGENMVEFSMHGGHIVVGRFLEAVCASGFRLAMPGEFSYRAFLNGKIDLVQAEATNTLINASSNLDALYSINNLKGALSERILMVSKKLENIITYIEHELDFDEGEIDFKTISQHIEKVNEIVIEIKTTIDKSFLINQSQNNISVVFVGRTNVGKSSLFNRLLGRERSIVDPSAGTTRDTVEAALTIDNMGITLIDTAGIRKTTGSVEKQGINKTYKAISSANIILYVDDQNPAEQIKRDGTLLINKKTILIQNKTDINKIKKQKNIIYTSAKKNTGIKKLFTEISTILKKEIDAFRAANLFSINLRQKGHLLRTETLLLRAVKSGKKSQDLAVFASELRVAADELDQLVLNKNKENIINNIFEGFCVGK